MDQRRFTQGAIFMAVLLISVGLGFLFLRLAPLDPPEGRLRPPGMVLLDSRGTVLQRDVRNGLRVPVRLDQVSPMAIAATIAAEDQRFWHHPGIDPIAIGRAVLTWGEAPSGASTITQQVARRLYLRDDQGSALLRKLREALLALQIEAGRSKEEILALYLNDVYYGRGAYGIEAAARAYFGVPARELTAAQAALLAGLPQLPGLYDPAADPQPARRRQGYVLGRLLATGVLNQSEAVRAREERLQYVPATPGPVAPHFAVFVREELQRLMPTLGDVSGLVIDTTLDADLQWEAERSVRARMEELRDRKAAGAALVALNPANGHILAMVGSPDFWDEAHAGQVNMALEPRHPGSALKPFLYAAAFERGMTPATPLLDVPTTFETPRGPYSPSNYDRRFHGVVPLRVALASSYNVPAVRTLQQLGKEVFLEILYRVGLRTLSDPDLYGPALALGGAEVRLLDLTAAYGAVATGGLLVDPVAITRVRDGAGRVLYQAPQREPRRVLSPGHAYLLADILSDAAARRPGFGELTPLDTPFRAAVKTGTTAESQDNWTVGFTRERVVGVWVGNPTGTPMENVSGVDGAGPIWRDVLMASVKGRDLSWLERPEGVVAQEVCSPTGLLPGSQCPSVVGELFLQGTQPAAQEDYYHREAVGPLVRNPDVEARAWALDAGVATGQRADPNPRVHILQPAPGAVLFFAPELPRQETVLRAAVPADAREVEFIVDGRVVARTLGADPRAIWRLEPGGHRLEVATFLENEASLRAAIEFEVRER